MSDKELNINIRTNADTSGATQTAEALDKVRETGESIPQTAQAMDQVTESLGHVKTAAEDTGAAVSEGMGPEQEKALENARSKIDEYADALTAAGSRMKAAFEDNPGLTGFIDEVTNAVLTSEEFRKKLEQVDDVFEVLNDRTSNLDLGAKWGDDLDENLQKIIDDYNKEMDAADKAADKAEAAEARKQKAAAATVERLEAGNRRATATYEELQAELESYIAKLEEARKAGDNVAQADALKNIQDLGRRIKTAGDAGELTSTQVKGLAGQVTLAATRILGMSSSLRGAIPFIRLFGTTIKTAMGPLGWAMLLVDGLAAGITALIDNFKTKSDELAQEAEKKAERIKKIAADAAEAVKKSYSLMMDDNRNDRTNAVNKGFEDFVKGITTQYRLQTEEIERQIQLRREEAARQKGIDTQEAELARVNLDNDFEDGKITKRQRDYGMMMINQNLDEKIRLLDLNVSQKEFMDHGKKLDTAVQARDKWEEKDFDMKFIQGQMPSLQEVRGLFNQQQKAQERIDAANRELQKTQESIKELENTTGNKRTRGYYKELEETRQREQRLISALDTAQSEGNAATVRIDELRELFRQSDVNFEPSYQPGTDVNSRAGEYQKALEDQNTKAQEVEKSLAAAIEKAGELGDIMANYVNSIVDQERGLRTQDRINVGNVRLFNKKEDKKEKLEGEKLEEERAHIREQAEKEAARVATSAQKNYIKDAGVQGITNKTPERVASGAREAFEAGKKEMLGGINGTDDQLTAQDIQRGFSAIDDVLKKIGLYTQSLSDTLKGQLTQVGNTSVEVFSRMEALERELKIIKRTQKMQLNREKHRR